MAVSIILIGPVGAGKTTLAGLLASRLGWTSIDLDDLRWSYYAELDYDAAYVESLKTDNDWHTIGRYWKPFEVHAVERVLADYPSDHIIAFGAGNSVYDSPDLFERARKALAPFPHVVLLMPVPEAEQSAAILRQCISDKMPQLSDTSLDYITLLNMGFIGSPSNVRLAKQTLYTDGLTPEQTCDAVLQIVGTTV
jgi:shikimate kinase